MVLAAEINLTHHSVYEKRWLQTSEFIMVLFLCAPSYRYLLDLLAIWYL